MYYLANLLSGPSSIMTTAPAPPILTPHVFGINMFRAIAPKIAYGSFMEIFQQL